MRRELSVAVPNIIDSAIVLETSLRMFFCVGTRTCGCVLLFGRFRCLGRCLDVVGVLDGILPGSVRHCC